MKKVLLLALLAGSQVIWVGCRSNKQEASRDQEAFRDQVLSSGGHAKVFTATLVLGGASHEDTMMIQCALDGSPDAQTKLKIATELFEMIRPTCEAMRLNKGEIYISKGQSSQGDFDLISFKRNLQNSAWDPNVSSGFSIEGPTTKK